MDGERTGLAAGFRARAHVAVGVEWRVAWRALWTSRLVVWMAGLFAVLEIGRAPNTQGFDPAHLTEPFGYLGDLLVSPAARWDSKWYLEIAAHGYSGDPQRPAFFPLYPLLVHVGGWIFGSPLIAGLVISLACFFVALALIHRLAALDLGPRYATAAVLLVAFFPAAHFFSAVYTESLFLVLTVGCVLAGRHGRWALAGLLGGLAALTRNTGLLLLVPLVVLYLWGPREDAAPGPRRGWRPRYPVRLSILWLALVPAGLAAFFVYLSAIGVSWRAPIDAGEFWFRHFTLLGGVRHGAVAAWDGLRQLAQGTAQPVLFTKAGGDPFAVAGINITLFGFFLVSLPPLVLAMRRLPAAYWLYALVSLVVVLSEPADPQPLASLPRYLAVIFPLALAVASWAEDRRVVPYVVAASGTLLGVFAAEFATWRFVA